MSLVDGKGNSCAWRATVPAHYFLPASALVSLEDGARVARRAMLSPVSPGRFQDSRYHRWSAACADLFEARKPKEPAILAEISGTVSFGKETKGKRRLVITPTDGTACPMAPITSKPSLRSGATCRCSRANMWRRGEVVSKVRPARTIFCASRASRNWLAKYIVNEIQEVYRLQGVKINDKHIEVIVRQMLRKVVITSSGDSTLIKGEQVEFTTFLEENERLLAEGLVPANGERELLGITKASLATESFISAASFQDYPGSDRGCCHRQARLPAAWKENGCGSPDTCRYRPGLPCGSQAHQGQPGPSHRVGPGNRGGTDRGFAGR